MNAKPFTEEAGRMWREEQQMIRSCLEWMIRKNTLPKRTVVADHIGMGHDEFHSKISINPRTPLQWSERIGIEHYIARNDPESYQQYLRSLHLNDAITVEEDDQWVRGGNTSTTGA
jgi:hypothetical protein